MMPVFVIVLVLLSCARTPGDPEDRSAAVDALFRPLTEGIQPGAAVLVSLDGDVVHEAGYGYADLEARMPITARSAFRLASVSKQFACMAVMLLAEEGVLDYDDPVSRWLPALAVYPGVTIRHLMTHTGGLPDYYDLIDTSAGMPTNDDALEELARLSPVFAAGERYEYSNSGYDMLANLVAAASGMDFATFVDERIFTPLGMDDSVVHDHTLPSVRRRAYGYDPTDDGYVRNDDDPLNGIVGSGGIYTTLHDMHRWDQALYSHALVEAETLEEAFVPAIAGDGESTEYGFGWRIDEWSGRRRVRHGGSWVGFRTHIARYPDDGLTIVILSNRSDLDPEGYIDAITEVWLTPR